MNLEQKVHEANKSPTNKIYFRNLDGLRFIAAFLVILEHCALFKGARSAELSNVFVGYVHDLGSKGVNLFFVLSGFLITYLLLVEKQQTGTISVPKFYMRRILRIWGLYFGFGLFSLFAGGFVLSRLGLGGEESPYLTNLLYLFTFTVNFQLIYGTFNRAIVEVYWSVCIEEQFYLIWVWVGRFFSQRMIQTCFILIIIAAIARYGTAAFYNFDFADKNLQKTLYFGLINRIDLFAIGGIAATMLLRRENYAFFFNFLSRVTFQIGFLIFALLYVFNIFNLFDFTYPEYSFEALLFAVLILVLIQPTAIVNFENVVLKKMGTYSYGIYVFHSAVAQLILFAFVRFVPNNFLTFDVLYPVTVTIVTCLISMVSYEFFEKQLLKLKNKKFTVVKNHDVVK